MGRPKPAQPPQRVSHESMPLPAEGLTIGVISDTHSRAHPGALPLLEALSPDLILHAGDIGDTAVLSQFKLAPMLTVRGNIDPRSVDFPDSVVLTLRADDATLTILLTHIAVRGQRLLPDARKRAEEAHADLVVCGHSHMPLLVRDRGIGVFNPGSIGPRRFQLPITLGAITVSPRGANFRHYDCETGQPWPPARSG